MILLRFVPAENTGGTVKPVKQRDRGHMSMRAPEPTA